MGYIRASPIYKRASPNILKKKPNDFYAGTPHSRTLHHHSSSSSSFLWILSLQLHHTSPVRPPPLPPLPSPLRLLDQPRLPRLRRPTPPRRPPPTGDRRHSIFNFQVSFTLISCSQVPKNLTLWFSSFFYAHPYASLNLKPRHSIHFLPSIKFHLGSPVLLYSASLAPWVIQRCNFFLFSLKKTILFFFVEKMCLSL